MEQSENNNTWSSFPFLAQRLSLVNLVDHTLLLYMTGQNLVFFLLLKSYFTADQVLNLLEKIKILLFSL